MRIGRLLKGIAVTAVTWGAAWPALTIAFAGIAALVGAGFPPREVWKILLIRSVVGGAMNGAVFATALAAVSRRQTVMSLRMSRVMPCGALGGAVVPLLTTAIFIGVRRHSVVVPAALPVLQLALSIAASAAFGAVCAGVSLRLARGAPEVPAGGVESPAQFASV